MELTYICKRIMKKILLILFLFSVPVLLADNESDLFGAKKAVGSQFPGEYTGTYFDDGEKIPYGLQIFALGDGRFRAVGYNGGLPGAGFKKSGKIEIVEGKAVKAKKGERIEFKNDEEIAIADLHNGRLVGREDGVIIARLKKITRKNPVVPKK